MSKYNGWSNYATWRVHLEILGDIQFDERVSADYLKEIVEDCVFSNYEIYSGSTHQLQEKWAPVLNHGDLPEIKDSHRRQVTAQLLENQERALSEESAMLNEAAPINSVGADGLKSSHGSSGLAGFDPILISLMRRAMPNLVAYDVCGVQPMSGPTGLIFAMKSHYNDRSGAEALFNEPNPGFSAEGLQTSVRREYSARTVPGKAPCTFSHACRRSMEHSRRTLPLST